MWAELNFHLPKRRTLDSLSHTARPATPSASAGHLDPATPCHPLRTWPFFGLPHSKKTAQEPDPSRIDKPPPYLSTYYNRGGLYIPLRPISTFHTSRIPFYARHKPSVTRRPVHWGCVWVRSSPTSSICLVGPPVTPLRFPATACFLSTA